MNFEFEFEVEVEVNVPRAGRYHCSAPPFISTSALLTPFSAIFPFSPFSGMQAHSFYTKNNGARSVAVGVDAGQQNTGSNSVLLGFEAGRSNIGNTSTNSPLIYGEFDNNVVGINGNLGVGEINPVYQLDVRDNTSTGYVAQFLNSNTSPNASGMVINMAAETNSNSVFLGFIDVSGFEGSITGTNGNAVSFNTTSDGRLKTDINPIKNALSSVRKMNPSTYKWKSNGADDMGFIAQELQEVIPFAVAGDPNSDPSITPVGVDYSRVTPVLTAAIKELLAKVDALEEKVRMLEDLR